MADTFPGPLPANDELIYTDAGGISYDWEDFLDAAKGNVKYASALRERVTWQSPYTVVDEDIRDGEVVVFDDQIIMLNQNKSNGEKLRRQIRDLFL